MSECQYYEFQAIDRPLTKQELAELRELSTRATITPSRFVNVYNYGDFRGNPEKLMEKYFDAFLYLANWGTHRLMHRFPQRLLDLQTASLYCPDDPVSVRTTEENVILEFLSDDEEGGRWVDDEEGEGWMASLLPVRAELAGGDYGRRGHLTTRWRRRVPSDGPWRSFRGRRGDKPKSASDGRPRRRRVGSARRRRPGRSTSTD